MRESEVDVGAVGTMDTETTTCRQGKKRLLRFGESKTSRVSKKQLLRVAESGVDVVAVYRDDGHGDEL